MGQKGKTFRLTKKGKAFITVCTIAILTIPVVLMRTKFSVLLGINKVVPKNTVNIEIIGCQEDIIDKINLIDNILLNGITPHRNPYLARATVKKTNVQARVPAVDEEFFSKALFIGDSITEGIKAYGILDNSNVFAVKGLTISKAEKEIDSIVKRNPQKIYILLGSNDLLYGMDCEKFSTRYIEFIQMINDKLPNAKVYIQSIFPVSRDVETNRPMLSNSRIDEFNAKLKVTAEQKGINYINVSELLKDGNGIMNAEYTSDGIHVKYKFYNIWLDCVKRNSIKS